MKEIKEYYSKIVHHLLTEIDNTPIDNAQDIDIVMQMYNLIEYNNNYIIRKFMVKLQR